jgi:hypothetical protein
MNSQQQIRTPQGDQMSEEVKTLMARYGITCAPNMIYTYKQYKYETFTDALRYAESDARRTEKVAIDTSDTPAQT